MGIDEKAGNHRFGFKAYNEPFGKRAFISYKRDDVDRIYNVVNKLATYPGSARNLWYDDNIPLGDKWEPTIQANIRVSSCVIAFVSHKIFDGYMREELKYADKIGKPIIMIFVDDFTPNLAALSNSDRDLWEKIQSYQIIKFDDRDPVKIAQDVHDAIKEKMRKDHRPIGLLRWIWYRKIDHPRFFVNLAASSFLALIALGVFFGVFIYSQDLLQDLVESMPPAVTTASTTTTTTTTRRAEPTIQEIGQSPPVFSTFSASSCYYQDDRNTCKPVDAFDDDTSTVWQEGVSDYGIGEYLYASAYNLQHVKSVTIVNGYAGSAKYFDLNSRVAALRIEWEGGSTIVTLRDTSSKQTFDLGGINTTWMRFTIIDVYEGDKYADTCIADIYFN